MSSINTLADALDAQTATAAEIGFIDGADDERRLSYKLLSRATLRLLAVLQDQGAKPGDHVILFVADNLRFVQFFWAAICGDLRRSGAGAVGRRCVGCASGKAGSGMEPFGRAAHDCQRQTHRACSRLSGAKCRYARR